jgi:serine/threonine protein kinase
MTNFTILGYRITKQLYESTNSLIYRGYRVSDEQPVVLKILKDTYPSPERRDWFKQEYEVTRNLTIPGVVDAYAFLSDRQHLVMVLEDFGGNSLALLGVAGQLEFNTFIELVTHQPERDEIAKLNLMASQKAKAATA